MKKDGEQGCDMIDKVISVGLDHSGSRSRAHDRVRYLHTSNVLYLT
jgi:hypothetical protein